MLSETFVKLPASRKGDVCIRLSFAEMVQQWSAAEHYRLDQVEASSWTWLLQCGDAELSAGRGERPRVQLLFKLAGTNIAA